MTKPRIFTPDEVERYIRLARNGTPRDVIAQTMRRPLGQIVNLHATLKRNGRIGFAMPPAMARKTDRAPHPLAGREAEIRKLSEGGKGYRDIALMLGVSVHKTHLFMKANNLFAPERLRQPSQRTGAPQPSPIRLPPVHLPDVDEADVRLARQAWRELERGAV